MPARTASVTGTGQPRRSRNLPASAWPPRACLDLGAVLTAPGCARAWIREILWEWGAAELADAAELVASELVTNSVNASAELDRAVIRLVLTLNRGELAILVRDGHPGTPLAGQPGADDEGGRGLLIVEHLSDRCGWYPLDTKPGKVTWAVLSGTARHGGEPTGGRHPDADTSGPEHPAQVLPTRPRQTPPLITGMRAPRLVDLEILARVKVALERL